MQEPTVLVRIPGKTRDRLLDLRQKAGYWGRLESMGATIARLVDEAKPVPLPQETKATIRRAATRSGPKKVVNKRPLRSGRARRKGKR